ncbi:MAG: TetR/AcrR family transcriptional regulator [Gemmatimonadales bacterium]|nr:TetR/AcrR family transcriptional regulator [Gemmatimonadales bacterium]
MSPRPRTVEDGAIAAAFARVLTKIGPAKLTLAAIAREAGLSPSTLIQRFGSKEKLIRRLSKGAGDGTALVAAARAEGKRPLVIVREFLLCYAGMAPTPQAMIHSFSAYLQIDLADPTLRRYLVESGRTNEGLIAQLLEEAVRSGDLRPVDTRRLARVLFATVTGSLLAWATFREGSSEAWLGRDLDHLLGLARPT